jgi:hypothetical protein
VEVFSEDSQPVAAHSRLTGLGKFSTYDSHYPEKKLSVARFEVHHAKEQAKKLGPEVQKLVDKLFATDHPLRHLRRVQGILRLAKAIRSRLRLWSMPVSGRFCSTKHGLATSKTARFIF